jgi:outer membrane lipoprotein-sorting protein
MIRFKGNRLNTTKILTDCSVEVEDKMKKSNVSVRIKLLLVPLFVLFLLPSQQWSMGDQDQAGDDAKIRKVLKKMDELYRSNSSTATVEMEITTPYWQRTLKMDFWSLGMKKTFIRILAPKKEHGTATLRVDNEMWNFLPKTDKVIKVPPSMMMGSWMGSDFTNDDLVKEYTFMEDYTFEMTTFDNPEAGMMYIKCTPKEGRPIVWGHIILGIQDADLIPIWYKYYDEKGKLMREMLYKEVKEFSGRKIPAVMELVPTNKKGNKTVIRYLKATFDQKIDKKIFSLRNLRTK